MVSKTSPKRPLRVALASELGQHGQFGAFLGVLDYCQGVNHWQISGGRSEPTLALRDLDVSAVDGVIGLFRSRTAADAVLRAGVPAVNISSAADDVPLPRAIHDDEAIGRLGAEHLVACGFPHFAFLGKPMWYSARRRAGFQSVIEKRYGRSCHAADLPTRQAGPVRNWLRSLPLPVAVMTSDDQQGRLLISVATELGLSMPGEVAVLGVNNDPWLTQLVPITMSSVEPDWHQLGYRAAQMLDRLMAGDTAASIEIPPLRVVVRNSTDITITDDPLVTQALALIHDQCDAISVDALAQKLRVSRRSLQVHMKRAIGQTPHAAIGTVRMQRAKHALMHTNATLAEIAANCGIAENQFYALFKRRNGMTPGQYRTRFGLRQTTYWQDDPA